MEHRFPTIRFADFQDPQPPDLPALDDDNSVARTTSGGGTRAVLARPRMALREVWVQSVAGGRSAARTYAADRDHADLPPDAVGHFRFHVAGPLERPVAADDQVKIGWRIYDPGDKLDGGLLEVYVTGSDVPVWTRELDAGELRTDLDDEDRALADGEFVGGLAWDGSLPDVPDEHEDDFPDGMLRAARSPYKLKLSIYTRKRRALATREAWTYFDVPARHRYKLVSYVPTTDLGRFGLEFDPAEGVIKVFSRVFFLAETTAKPWASGPEPRRGELIAGCQQAWSDRFALRRGGGVGRTFRLGLRVVDCGLAHSDREGAIVEEHGPALVDAALRARADLVAILRPGQGQSGLATKESRTANVFLYEQIAFATHHSPTLGARAVVGELRRLEAALRAAITGDAHASLAAAMPIVNIMVDPPTIDLTFGAGVHGLERSHKRAVELIAAEVGARADVIPFHVYVSAASGGHDTARASAVEARLARFLPGGHPCTRAADDAIPRRTVRVRIGSRDDAEQAAMFQTPIAYTAAVHEFGHSLGLVDEYMDYGATPGFEALERSQERLQTLCDRAVVPTWARPESDNGDMMSAGTRLHKRYYLPLREALRVAIGVEPEQLDRHWTLEDRDPGAAPLAAVDESPDFDAHVRCVRAVERLIDHGVADDARLVGELQTQAAYEGLDLAYAKLVRRKTLRSVRRALRPGDHVLVCLGAWRGNTLMHTSIHARSRRVAPVIEPQEVLPAPVGARASDWVVHPRGVGESRQPVLVRASGGFEGQGVFLCDQAGADFYREASGGAVVYERVRDFAAGLVLTADELARGVTLHAEGLRDGALLSLRLSSNTSLIETQPVGARLTFPTAPTLRVYPATVDPDETPAPLSVAQMRSPGLVVPLSPGWQPGLGARSRVVVARPAGSTGALYLRVSPGVRIFKQAQGGHSACSSVKRRPADGGPRQKWRELRLRARDFTGDLLEVWLEGQERSVMFSDRQLVLADDAAEHVTCAVTVVGLDDLDLYIPASAPLQVRGNQPVDQTYEVEVQAAQEVGADRALCSREFPRNPPLVLLAGASAAARPIELRVRLKPGKITPPVVATLQRADDDDARLRTAYTGPTPLGLRTVGNPAPDQTQDLAFALPGDAVGSFHVHLRVGGSTLAVVNVVGVRASAVDRKRPHTALVAGYRAAVTAALVEGRVDAHTGPVPFPDPNARTRAQLKGEACTTHDGTVELVGGGPDGKRGLDRVFAGWIQNKTGGRIEATYTDATGGGAPVTHVVPGVMVRNSPQGDILPTRDRYFTPATANPPDPMPHPVYPLLDTGRDADGGMTATLGQRKLERDDSPAFGQRLRAMAVDSPGTEFLARHRAHGDALLTGAVYEQAFRAHLCVWTDMTGRDAGGGPGDRLYGVVAHFDWTVKGAWTITWPAATATGMSDDFRRDHPNWWQTGAVVEAREFKARRKRVRYYPALRAAEGTLEVRPPTPLQLFAWDYTA